jgi:SAM-dependent methyltransferase
MMNAADIKEFWNSRFEQPGFMYGDAPNVFFKSIIDSLTPGRLFVPGAGEGRDAVYAAEKGWDVYCVDLSDAGQTKALQLAATKNVTIKYIVADIDTIDFPETTFDAIACIFFHLPQDIRTRFYANAAKWLKPNGHFLLVSFSPDQLNNSSGGPKDLNMLTSAAQIKEETSTLNHLTLEECETILDEGKHHSGKANVVHCVAQKI